MVRPVQRFVDACVALSLRLGEQLRLYKQDSYTPESKLDPFAAVYRDFTVLHVAASHKHGWTLSPNVLEALPGFCFPEGGMVLSSPPPREAATIYHVALAESGVYATCVSFHRVVDASHFFAACRDSANMRGVDKSLRVVYIPCVICLVSRWPYLRAMRDCAAYIFQTLSDSQGHLPLPQLLDDVYTKLSVVPIPPAGRLSIAFRLGQHRMVLRPRCHDSYPAVDVPFRLLLLRFKHTDLVTILTALMFEKTLIFFSEDLSIITPMLEAIKALMYPFVWQHTYIPIVPATLRSVVEAPMPVLVGIHAKYRAEIEREIFGSLSPTYPYLVDLDSGSVVQPPANAQPVPTYPEVGLAAIAKGLEGVQLYPDFYISNKPVVGAETNARLLRDYENRVQSQIRAAFLRGMLVLFDRVVKHMDFDDDSPVFHFEKFLGSRPVEYQAFYREFCLTSTFKAFKKTRHRLLLDYFDQCAENILSVGLSAVDDGTFAELELPSLDNVLFDVGVAGVHTVSPKARSFLGNFFRNREQQTSSHNAAAAGSRPTTPVNSPPGSAQPSPNASPAVGRKSLRSLPSASSLTTTKSASSTSDVLMVPLEEWHARRRPSAPASQLHSLLTGGSSLGSAPSSSAAAIAAASSASTPAVLPSAYSANSSSSAFCNEVIRTLKRQIQEMRVVRGGATVAGPTHSSSSVNSINLRPQEASTSLADYRSLLGVFHLATGNVEAAFNEFSAVAVDDFSRFPLRLIKDTLRSVEGARSVLTLHFLQGQLLWNAVSKASRDDDDDSVDDDSQWPEFLTLPNVLEALSKQEMLHGDEITRLLSGLGISDQSSSALLLESLTSISHAISPSTPYSDSLTVTSGVMTHFLQSWRATISENRYDLSKLITLEADEKVLKIMPGVRFNRSMGTLVLTHNRLVHVVDKKCANELTLLSNIESVERITHKVLIPPGQPALRIMSRQVKERPHTSSFSRRPSLTPKDPNQEIVLIFLSDRDAWYYYIKEMAVSHQVAKGSLDGNQTIREAATNIALLEAVTKVELTTSVKRTADFSVEDPEKVPALLRFCRSDKEGQSVLPSTLEHFVKRIDPCPNNVTKPTVECLAYLPLNTRAGTLWCGLASGDIQTIELQVEETGHVVHNKGVSFRPFPDSQTRSRMTCLLHCGATVWVAFLGSKRVYVCDAKFRRVATSFVATEDAVSCLTLDEDGGSVWSASGSGEVVEWDMLTYSRLNTFHIPPAARGSKTCKQIILVNNDIWCALGSRIVVLDRRTGELRTDEAFVAQQASSRMSSSSILSDDSTSGFEMSNMPSPTKADVFLEEEAPELPDFAVVIRTHAGDCLAPGSDGEVWSGAQKDGLVCIWACDNYGPTLYGSRWDLDCGGVTCLVSTDRHVIGGLKSNGVVVWDKRSHGLLRMLSYHTDAVRSVCLLSNGLFATGSSSLDGTVVLWRFSSTGSIRTATPTSNAETVSDAADDGSMGDNRSRRLLVEANANGVAPVPIAEPTTAMTTATTSSTEEGHASAGASTAGAAVYVEV
eukprot:m.201513 g.201513  ORF g.201513 m.201513 type:complete len:1523 (-) comp17706_c0_seq3:219-4787(-)